MSQHEKTAYRKMHRDHYEEVYHIDIMKEKTLSVLYGLFINNLKPKANEKTIFAKA